MAGTGRAARWAGALLAMLVITGGVVWAALILEVQPMPAGQEQRREADDPAQVEKAAEPIAWDTSANKWQNRLGQRFSFSCPAAGAVGNVYGDGPYSTGSSICSAAVHAGRMSAVDGGTVTIRIIGAVDGAQDGTLRHGVRSSSYFGNLSFVFE